MIVYCNITSIIARTTLSLQTLSHILVAVYKKCQYRKLTFTYEVVSMPYKKVQLGYTNATISKKEILSTDKASEINAKELRKSQITKSTEKKNPERRRTKKGSHTFKADTTE